MQQDLVEVIARDIERHALFTAGDGVLAMVSGGADSMCLLDILRRVHPGRLGVLTLDHGFRPESAGECAAVMRTAAALGLEAWSERLQLAAGSGLQARARAARYAAATALAELEGFQVVATGHTSTDQAETVLFRIARGTGRTGAIGMRPRVGELVRPLLGVRRDQARAWCAAQQLAVSDDPSNLDDSFTRVRIRRELMPALAGIHPDAEGAVTRFAELLADEADLLQVIIDAAWNGCTSGAGLDAQRVAQLPVPVARLVVRRLLAEAGVVADSVRVAQTLQLVATGQGRFDAPGGLVAIDRGVLNAGLAPPTAPEAVAVPVPGRASFGAREIRATVGPACPATASSVSVRLESPILVRSAQPGDRITLAGGGRGRVGRILAAAGVPARERHLVPLVVDAAGRVVWIGGYRADPGTLAPPGETAIRLELV